MNGASGLIVRLEQADAPIEQGVIPAESVPMSHGWVTYTFAAAQTLRAGQTYALVLTAPANDAYSAVALQKASVAYGFSPATGFVDGHAEADQGGGWRGWEVAGNSQRTDGDLQFFFTVTSVTR